MSIGRLFTDSERFGSSPGLAAQHARRWARRLTREMGLSITSSGPRPTRGALVVANHRSYVDIVALLAQVPAVFVAKAEIQSWPLLGRAAQVAHTLFIQRDSATSREATRAAMKELLRHGVSVVVFPEGTTSAGPGTLGFRPGPFRIAAELGIPVAPAAISYPDATDAWVGDDTFLRHFLQCFGKPRVDVTTAFGPELFDADAEALCARAERWVRAALARLDSGDSNLDGLAARVKRAG